MFPNKIAFLCFVVFSLNSFILVAQKERQRKKQDTIVKQLSKRQLRKIRLVNDPLTPSRAAFYSAILPGLGQAHIGKAWKVPIVYGAIGFSAYSYLDNHDQMKRYRSAYKRRLAGYSDDEFQSIFPENDKLLDGMRFHKSYRDISMLFVLGFYMLNILDANVSAHLMQFNVSDDLSVSPQFIVDPNQTGMRLAIKF